MTARRRSRFRERSGHLKRRVPVVFSRLYGIVYGNFFPLEVLLLNTHETRITVVCGFAHFMAHFNMLAFPTLVLPLASRLHMEMAQVLGLSFWMYLLFGITALPWGMAADRLGARNFMLLQFLGAGTMGLVASFMVDTPWAFSLALAGIGAFSGIYHPIGLGMISKNVSRMTMALGYNGMCGNLGLFAGPLISGLCNWMWGPSGVYVVLGAFNLTGLAVMLLLPFKEGTAAPKKVENGNGGYVTPFIILLSAMMLGGIAYRGATVILPTFFELKSAGLLSWLGEQLGTAPSGNLLASLMASFIFMIGIVGQYAGGRVGEKFDLRYGYLAFHASAIPAVLILSRLSDLPMLGMAVIYFFFLLGMQPIENTLVARLSLSRFRHSAYGMKFVMTFGTGSLSVKLVGLIEKAYGIEAAFLALGMVSTLLVCCILALIRATSQGSGELPATAPAGGNG